MPQSWRSVCGRLFTFWYSTWECMLLWPCTTGKTLGRCIFFSKFNHYHWLFHLNRWQLWKLRRVRRPGRSWRVRRFGFRRRAATKPGWRLCAPPCSTVEESGVRLCCCRGRCAQWVHRVHIQGSSLVILLRLFHFTTAYFHICLREFEGFVVHILSQIVHQPVLFKI